MTTESFCSNASDPKEEKKVVDTNADMTCDYLVVGAGATGMAFADTLLAHSTTPGPSIVMVDKHDRPGGQWNDSYSFVRLHQPSKGYGVETEKLEPSGDDRHRANRSEILAYYDRVRRKLEARYEFRFVGGARFDFSQLENAPESRGREQSGGNAGGTLYQLQHSNTSQIVRVMKRVVDARYLEPDLPIFIPPKFSYNKDSIKCIPVNSLADVSNEAKSSRYVVIGGGKTGMDAITYLQTQMNVEPNNIMWVFPNDAWITAREDIGSCIEFLHTCTEIAKRKCAETGDKRMVQLVTSKDFFQDGFLEWERAGKIYRLDEDTMPTKFKDATLCKDELALIRKVTRVIRHHGRVKAINDNGNLQFVDGATVPLPWASNGGANETTFVHASAGAFNYSKHPDRAPPVFDRRAITIQDVYGTPGFCFVGSVLGKLESLGDKLSDDDKNAMCLAPKPDALQAKLPLGPSGGDVGVISSDHGYVQRVSNLKMWLEVPEMKKWLSGHRLFNLGHLEPEQIHGMVEQITKTLVECGLICI